MMKRLEENKWLYKDNYGVIHTLVFAKDLYAKNYNQAIMILEETDDGMESYCSLTVNLIPLQKGHAYLDTNGCAKEIIDSLETEKLITRIGEIISSGYCKYPLYEITELFALCIMNNDSSWS